MTIEYYVYFQLLSLVTALAFYTRLKSFKLAAFIPLLFVVCITELLSTNAENLGWESNILIYDLYVIISTPIIMYIYLQMLGYTQITRKIYIAIAMLLLVFTLLNFFFVQGHVKFDTYSLILVEFVIAILSLLMIAKLFQEDDNPIALNHHPYFWISASTLIFSAVTLIVLGLQQFLAVKNVQIGGVRIYAVIMPMINVFLYGCYSYAFYLCKKLTNKSLPQ